MSWVEDYTSCSVCGTLYIESGYGCPTCEKRREMYNENTPVPGVTDIIEEYEDELDRDEFDEDDDWEDDEEEDDDARGDDEEEWEDDWDEEEDD